MKSFLDALLGRREPDRPQVIRLSAEIRPALIYAIGDIHGCLDALLELEAMIIADAHEEPGEKWLIYLGDYVDRGPRSAQVIDHLMLPAPRGFRRICLRGNHEAAMLESLSDAGRIDNWLAFGGDMTLMSYGVADKQIDALFERRGSAKSRLNVLAAHIPEDHIGFLDGLATMVTVPGYIFVHAGLRPGIAVAQQELDDLIWIREKFLDSGFDFGGIVVHGHTIAETPETFPYRIGIDTGCYASGRLTAVKIEAGSAKVAFLQTEGATRRG